jgi:hypothetical protein
MNPGLVIRKGKMRAHLVRTFIIGLSIWVQASMAAPPQRMTSFSGTAKGQGMLTIGADKSKINSVYLNLKENGEADITLFTELQLSVKGEWSSPDDPLKGIPLKITGGIVDGNATGNGTLFLSSDGKAISKLNIQAKAAGTRKVTIEFVADKSQ